MRILLQPGFILHHRDYRETSLLLDIFTRDYGRISLIAKGTRKPRSRTRSLLQPFNPLLFSWYGKSELMTLQDVEATSIPIPLKGVCLLSAFYLNELLVRLLQKHDPHPQLYTIYQHTLLELAQATLQQKTLRLFEKKLLEELGYSLVLSQDCDRMPLSSDKFYRYIPEQGFQICQEGIAEGSATIFSGRSLIALAEEQLEDPNVLREIKRLMRIAFLPLLGNEPLQSRKLFLELQNEA